MRRRQREPGQGGAGITQHRLRAPYPICVIAAPPGSPAGCCAPQPRRDQPLLANVICTCNQAATVAIWALPSRSPRAQAGAALGGDHSPAFRDGIRGTGNAAAITYGVPGETSAALSLSRLGMLQILCPGSGWAQPGQESRSSSTAARFRGLWLGWGARLAGKELALLSLRLFAPASPPWLALPPNRPRRRGHMVMHI